MAAPTQSTMAAAEHPSGIIDTRENIDIISTRDTTDVLSPFLFGGFLKSPAQEKRMSRRKLLPSRDYGKARVAMHGV